MSEEFDKIMNFNAFAEAEKITGKSHRDDKETKTLGNELFRENREIKKQELIARNDTYYGMPFEETCAVYEEHGFKTIYGENFVIKREFLPDIAETFKVMWRDGIIIACESFKGKSTNSAEMYYNWVANDPDVRVVDFLDSGRFIQTESGKGVAGFHDIREGFVYKLSKFEDSGTFLTTWVDDALMWLANYSEIGSHENYGEIKNRKLASLTADIQEALKVCFES